MTVDELRKRGSYLGVYWIQVILRKAGKKQGVGKSAVIGVYRGVYGIEYTPSL